MKKTILIVFSFIFTSLFSQHVKLPDLIPFRNVDKWGFCNEFKEIKIPCDFDYVYPFVNQNARVVKNDKYGFINKKGEIVIPLEYDFLFDYEENYSRVKKNNKWGVIDKNGKEFIPIQYEYVNDLNNCKIWWVKSNGKWAIFNSKGIKLTDFQYNFIDSLDNDKQIEIPKWVYNGLILVYVNNKIGFIDSVGKCVIPFMYDSGNDFYQNSAGVKLNNNALIINKKNEIIHDFQTDLVNEINYSYIVNQNNKCGLFDRNGKALTEIKYDYISYFYDNLAIVKQNGKYGYIDRQGNEIIPLKFDEASTFYNGLAKVKLYNKYGFIDTLGKVVIDFKYNSTYPLRFENNFAIIEKDKKYGVIDINENIIAPEIYDFIYEFFNQNYTTVVINNKHGLIDKTGKLLIPCKFDYYLTFIDNIALGYINGIESYISINGIEFWID